MESVTKTTVTRMASNRCPGESKIYDTIFRAGRSVSTNTNTLVKINYLHIKLFICFLHYRFMCIDWYTSVYKNTKFTKKIINVFGELLVYMEKNSDAKTTKK